jgi:hypothetical protein
LFWTTRHEKIAAAQGWALAVEEEEDLYAYVICPAECSGCPAFADEDHAYSAVQAAAGNGDPVALLALAIVHADEVFEEDAVAAEGFESGLYG